MALPEPLEKPDAAAAHAQYGVPPVLEPVAFRTIGNWAESEHTSALETFRRSSLEILETGSGFNRHAAFGGMRGDWLEVCRRSLDSSAPRRFFEQNFRAFRVKDNENPGGLFTGYYEPEVDGSRIRSAEYPVPVYRKPHDLCAFTQSEEIHTGLKYGRRRNGVAAPYFLRQEIENGKLAGQGLEICWLKDWADAFFMHIQGSGRVKLVEGGTLRLAYGGKSGHPYTGIGGVLADRGVLARETMSMQSVRAWLRDNPDKSRELMWLNKSYVFFREIEVLDPGLGALGAAQVNLTPQCSLAVDRRHWMFGTPMWIETKLPPEVADEDRSFRRLMIAQDTGSAIRGYVRGDIYWGWGRQAAWIAGHMKSVGQMTVLLPLRVAERLGLGT